MKVKDVMTTDVRTCTPDTTVAEAAHLMWEGDCGILPVVDEGELVGVVTDRDMYIALATQNARASHVRVGAIAARSVVTCAAEDDIEEALTRMKDARVRRLPVVGFGSGLVGMLSINDILLAVDERDGVRMDVVLQTLRAICGHHHPVPHIVGELSTDGRVFARAGTGRRYA
jgi:CBS domain-containing protein